MRRALALVALLVLPATAGAQYNGGQGVAFLSIRVGAPLLLRGPEESAEDTPATFINKTNATFNFFTANQSTYILNTASLTNVAGKLGSNIEPPVMGAADACGDWLTSTYKIGTTWWGMVHQEGPCYYSIGQTNKSMAMFSSTNEGSTWTLSGTSISGGVASTTRQITGIGDCTMVPDTADNLMWAYCGAYPQYTMNIAQAPLGNIAAGQWKIRYNGAYSGAAVGSVTATTDQLPWYGTFAAVIPGVAKVVLVSQDHTLLANATNVGVPGFALSISNDYNNFQTLNEPLVYGTDSQFGNLPATVDTNAYPILRNDADGSSTLNPGHFNLYWVWIPTGNTLSRRYLVYQPVTLTASGSPQSPQVGVALSRWTLTGGKLRATAAPVPGTSTNSAALGYLMTAAPASGVASTQLQEWFNSFTGDYQLGASSPGAGYVSQRVAGWVFNTGQVNTKALYLCFNSGGAYHFASNDNACEGLGTQQGLLGYALAS
jgi:hypothetical protein